MKKLVVVCALAAPALSVADEVGQWYVNPNAGGISVDNRRPLEDKDWLYGIGIGRHLTQGLSLEGNLTGNQLDGVFGAPDLSLYTGTLDLLGVANRDGNVSPYVSVGAGGARNNLSPGDDSTDFLMQAGVGAFMRIWRASDGSGSLSLRPDFKVRWQDAGAAGHLRDYVAMLGLTYSFGAPSAPVVAAALPPPPPAAPEPPPPPPPPTPPADTDGDGVTDNQDQCPGTPAGVAVDALGCPLKGSLTLDGVTFEYNSARLTAEARSVLQTLATNLVKFPRLKLELQGHTDSAGPDAYNLRLSQQRADAVRAFLVEAGISGAQLQAKGYGEAQPVDNNATEEGRSRNRRVVMTVLDNPGDVQVKGEGSVD
jgi:OmpA-OmpF porin, OOP family